MPEELLFGVVTFKRVYDTFPAPDVLTLPELVRALRRFEIKSETAAQIRRDVERIRRAHARWQHGEPARGKYMGKLQKAAESAAAGGAAAAVEEAVEHLIEDARRSAKQDLRLWSPTVYRPGSSKRGSEHVTHLSCLVLDYDDETPVAVASELWGAYFHCVHTTWSHTEAHPKFRLVMPLSRPVRAEDWERVWAWAERVSHAHIDPSMKGPAATYALPASPSEHHPRLAFSRPGALLDPVAEGILPDYPVLLSLSWPGPQRALPSVMLGEDADKVYVDQPEEGSEEGDIDPYAPEDARPEISAAPETAAPVRASTRETDTGPRPKADTAHRPKADTGPPPKAEASADLMDSGALRQQIADLARRVERLESRQLEEAMTRTVDTVERLYQLHKEGAIGVDEFQRAKQRVLEAEPAAGMDPTAVDPVAVGRGKHGVTICLDFDGVLHSYRSGWQGPLRIVDPPVDGAMAFLEAASEQYDLVVHSVRGKHRGGIAAMRRWLAEQGLSERALERLRFAKQKPPAHVYIDDRAFRFEGRFPSLSELGALQPWTRRGMTPSSRTTP